MLLRSRLALSLNFLTYVCFDGFSLRAANTDPDAKYRALGAQTHLIETMTTLERSYRLAAAKLRGEFELLEKLTLYHGLCLQQQAARGIQGARKTRSSARQSRKQRGNTKLAVMSMMSGHVVIDEHM